MTLMLIEFNNYFNRIVKKYDSYEDYISKSTNYHFIKEQYNFNPNDGVNANVIINWTLKWNPDYLLCLNDNNEIVSRWYIMESVRTRGGQYSISLRRDVISDKYDTVLDSPCFIEKGFVSEDNPLIFNKEQFDSNQIKVNEIFLNDESKCSWIALYYDKGTKKQDLKGSVVTIEEDFINIGSTLENWNFYQRYVNGYKKPYKHYAYVNVEPVRSEVTRSATTKFDENFKYFYESTTNEQTLLKYAGYQDETFSAVKEVILANKDSLTNPLTNFGNPLDNLEDFTKYNNRIIKTSDNKFYRVKIDPMGDGQEKVEISSGDLYNALVNCFQRYGVFVTGFSGSFTKAFFVETHYLKWAVSFDLITNGVETINYDFSSCRDVIDAPYGILLLPYKGLIYLSDRPTLSDQSIFADLSGINRVSPGVSLLIAQDLCKAGVGPDKMIYDAQILPYCPFFLQASMFSVAGVNLPVIGGLSANQYTSIYNSSNNFRCFALHPTAAKFTKNITYRTFVGELPIISVPDLKLDNQLKVYRLCSPNFNGIFEFSAAKNGGVQYFNVDCTYKPYSPYIHVNPDFKNLYGEEFNDARGLICGGDFSLSIVSNAFETYKLQNKNFNEIFDRQIENMDVQYDINRTKNVVGLGLGLGKGVVGGAIAGGNPLSLGLGAATGLTSGITNLVTAKKSYEEQRDLTIDMHNFQLGNIKALPDSLTKVDAYNNNNKVFPILEVYDCTDIEKEIFRNKLKYEGMTVNAIGKIKDYLQFGETTFVKGQLLRLEELKEDNHFANEIFTEIAKGVYIA